ncbi:MAG: rRNA maturation RNase YbeY [Patescibacteria group bacterium]
MSLSITNQTRRPLPRVDFANIKDRILGKKYELSLVFCGPALSKRLNKTYRDKDHATNVLSFPISKTAGEIFIDLSTLKGFSVTHLFIHGSLHLKGMSHGDKMEKLEQQILNGTPNRSRN